MQLSGIREFRVVYFNPYGRVVEPLSFMTTLRLWVGPEDERESFKSSIVIALIKTFDYDQDL